MKPCESLHRQIAQQKRQKEKYKSKVCGLQQENQEQTAIIAGGQKREECLLGQLRRAGVRIRFPRPLWRARQSGT